ncbi:MAG: transketolase [Cyclobacteriaceae bacterium]|nr:transketolase [Cyclobacteriaceae bacterium]
MDIPKTVNTLKLDREIDIPVEEVLNDYKIAQLSRYTSLIGRKEVFLGKAKFGIFGDGKEIAQIAMAKAFKKGDFRSGYYRDQTFFMALGKLSIQQFFAQLYAHTDVTAEPSSAGRQMNAHFASRLIDENGQWIEQTSNYNTAADISPTSGQMPRLVGLAYASKLYRQNKDLHALKKFSIKGNEVAFGTIGNAATAEGLFLEAINAAAVLQIPMITAVWDDDYGISVPNYLQIAKSDIYKALYGFQRNEKESGLEMYQVKGWDYPNLIRVFKEAADLAREYHVPSLVHVNELTQPQGHSTSGSHERYKSKERLDWEREYDCNVKFREWILENEYASTEELDAIDKEAQAEVLKGKNAAWKAYSQTLSADKEESLRLMDVIIEEFPQNADLAGLRDELINEPLPYKHQMTRVIKKALRITRGSESDARTDMIVWLGEKQRRNFEDYNSHIYSESPSAAIRIKGLEPQYSGISNLVDGREILQACFDAAFARDHRIVAFGEDLGKIGDVNQGFAGLQKKYGELRITDTGIREASIIGQGIGLAMRGLRPIAEIQYLDYLVYALQTLTDDLATLQYRTKGGQKAPMIIRTRGHRLEGVWHAGSPISMILGSMRGIYILTPRNMTQAAGFYNTMFESDDAALIIESLNGYRLKEQMPDNIEKIKVQPGVPEILRQGSHITIVTYGSMCRIVMEAAQQLAEVGISAEVIDVQSLVPFDLPKIIEASIRKTGRAIFADEDVPGGGTAYMMQKVLDEQNAYQFLDAKPVAISAKEHRTAYGSDGDYFSKPNTEDVFDAAYQLMHEADPGKYPEIYH